ncbi:MarR family winged helix-turn-helix transcriptional regulator [Actinophytocola sediminis]
MAAGSEWPDEHGDDVLVRKLRQLTVELDRFIEVLSLTHGMHRTDLTAVALIVDAGQPLSPGELAHALHLSASATTALLDRLESAGHVRRERSTTDRRRIELRVNPEAREFRRAFAPLGRELSLGWGEFDGADRRVIARFLAASIDATVLARTALPPAEPR